MSDPVSVYLGEFPFGQAITFRAEFADENLAPTNPTTTTFQIGLIIVNPPPDPTASSAIFGIDPGVTNPAVGRFDYAYLPLVSGNYTGRAVGTGAVQAAMPFYFTVKPNPLV
jgi:hypothetical protein